jgi:methionine-rich copper-binding protein CopC
MKPIARNLAASALASVQSVCLAAEASADAQLVKSDPPEAGQPSDRQTLELTFSEAISGKLSSAEVSDASGRRLPSTSMVDQDNKGLMVMMKAQLAPGAYRLDWHAVSSDDGHRTAGTVSFSVK